MYWWVFNAEQLENALARFEAERMSQGVSQQQAQDELAVIAAFLISRSAKEAKLVGGNV